MKKDKLILTILVINLMLIVFLFVRMEQKKNAELDALVLGDEPSVTVNDIQSIERTVEPAVETPAPKAPVLPDKQSDEPVITADSLDNSDEQVLAAVMVLNPDIAQWLIGEERIRKLVLTVNTLANAELPNKHLPLSIHVDAFTVHDAGLDAQQHKLFRKARVNHARLQPLVDAITAIPADKAVAYYSAWLPVLGQAYSELGEQGSFHQRFVQAMDNIVNAPELDETLLLSQPHILYQFANADQESASAISKWLWRLGPENSMKIKAWLQALKQQLSAE